MTTAADTLPRVLMVDSERSWRGGEAQVRLLIGGLLEAGCRVGLAAAANSEIARRTRGLAVTHHPVSIRGGIDVAAARHLHGILRTGDYEIVHAHSSHAHGAAALGCVGLRRPPLRVVSRRVDFAVGRHALDRLKYRRGADAYLAISSRVRDVLVEAGVPPACIRLVPSGIDLGRLDRRGDAAALRRELGIPPGTPVIGNVAALAPHKAQWDLLRATRLVRERLGDVRVLVVGEGAMRPRLETLARELGVDDVVRFTGFRDDVVEVMALFDCFVMSSVLEGLGTAIMDAQAMGLPVVATDTGGIPDVVEDGVTGLLVPPGAPDALAAALVRMLTDEALRRRCVEQARGRSTGYDYHRMVYKTLSAYREFLAGRRGG